MPKTSPDRLDARRAELVDWLRKRDGVAHTSDARVAGFTGYEIADAVRAEVMRRVRRSWLVAPDCDERRVAAASVSGRVTCLTAAAMRGFWVPAAEETNEEPTHIAVASTAARVSSPLLRLHWGHGPAPTARNANEDPVLNVLFHVAHCLPQVEALAVWESAIRKKAIASDVLPRVAWRSSQATALASVASSLSDSGLETIFVDGMRRVGVAVRQQVWLDGRPVDGLIGDSLVVQLDGFAYHSSPADRRRDIEADARLVLRGFVVLRFDYHQLLFQWDQVLETILTAMAQGAHERPVTGPR